MPIFHTDSNKAVGLRGLSGEIRSLQTNQLSVWVYTHQKIAEKYTTRPVRTLGIWAVLKTTFLRCKYQRPNYRGSNRFLLEQPCALRCGTSFVYIRPAGRAVHTKNVFLCETLPFIEQVKKNPYTTINSHLK